MSFTVCVALRADLSLLFVCWLLVFILCDICVRCVLNMIIVYAICEFVCCILVTLPKGQTLIRSFK
jgi:hypothetical protein